MGPPGMVLESNATRQADVLDEPPSNNDVVHSNPATEGATLISQGSRRRAHLDSFTIGCWNVTTLEAPLAAEHLETTLDNYRYDIIALSETHNIGQDTRLQGKMLLSGGDRRYAGVGFLLSQRAQQSVLFTDCISDRLMAIRLKLKVGTLLVIAVYAPTSAAPDDIISAFYNQLDRWIHDNLQTNEKLIVAGDFNAKLGTERINASVLGPHGYGERNERGDRLIDFCTSNDLTAAHTWFRKRPSHKVTWTSRANNARNAIDHILVCGSLKNCLTDCRSFSAVFDTDHRLVLCNIKLKIACTSKPTKRQLKPDPNALREATTTQSLCDAVRNELDANIPLDDISTIIHANAIKTCNVAPFHTNKPYLTPDTIQLIHDKRKARNTADFPRLRNAVKHACDRDMKNWLLQQAEMINHAFATNDTHTLFKTTNYLTLKPNPPTANIKDKNGCTLWSVDDEIQRWEEYARELFHSADQRPQVLPYPCIPSPPTTGEITSAIKNLKNNKAPGSDLVLGEFIKAVAEDAEIRLALDDAVHDIWMSGTWPHSLTDSTYIVLHKKNDRGNCGNYRTLALISHMSKIVLNIIQQRLVPFVKSEVSDAQCGFVPGKSTVDAIFRVKGLAQAYLAVKQPLHLIFVDFRKAFDSVSHTKLFEMLRRLGMAEDLVRIIENLYSNAHGTISWKGHTSASFPTPAGVRQGCPISPSLFNIYTECIMRDWHNRTSHLPAPNVDGCYSKEQRYADDLVLMALTAADAEEMLNILGDIADDYGLSIHPDKTEYMVIQTSMGLDTISYRGNPLKRTSEFRYLGTYITHNLNDSREISARIAMTKATLKDCAYLKSHRISIDVKLHLIEALVASRLTYGCSTWTIKAADMNRLDALGREVWRRLLGFTWKDHVSNDVLTTQIAGRWLFSSDTILQRKAKWCGHAVRYGGLTSAVLFGLPSGLKRKPGRPHMRWIDNLTKWTGRSATQLLEDGRQRINIVKGHKPHVVYNLRGGQRANLGL